MNDAFFSANGHKFRRGVGLVLLNERDEVLAGKRLNSCPVEWQFPQGGRQEGEDVKTAGYRELYEELAVKADEAEYLLVLPEPTRYLLPNDYRMARGFDGQEHHWAVFRYLKDGLPDLTQALDKEFSELRWTSPHWVQNHTARFRETIYDKVTAMLRRSLPLKPASA